MRNGAGNQEKPKRKFRKRHHCVLETVNDDYSLFYTVTPRTERYTATDNLFSEAPDRVWLHEHDDKREVRMWRLLKQERRDPWPRKFVDYLVDRHGFDEISNRDLSLGDLIANNDTEIDLANYRQPARSKSNGHAPEPAPVPEPPPPTPPIANKTVKLEAKPEHKRENYFVQIPHVLIDDDRLSDGDIRTYCQLLSHDSTGDGIYARQDTLASWLRVRSVDSVQRRLTNLEKCGYLHVQRRGMSKTNIVRCLMRVKGGAVIRLDKDGNVVDE